MLNFSFKLNLLKILIILRTYYEVSFFNTCILSPDLFHLLNSYLGKSIFIYIFLDVLVDSTCWLLYYEQSMIRRNYYSIKCYGIVVFFWSCRINFSKFNELWKLYDSYIILHLLIVILNICIFIGRILSFKFWLNKANLPNKRRLLIILPAISIICHLIIIARGENFYV